MKNEKRGNIRKVGIITSWAISGLLLTCGIGASLSPLFTGITEGVVVPIAIGGGGAGFVLAVLSMVATFESMDYTVKNEPNQEKLKQQANEPDEKSNGETKELSKKSTIGVPCLESTNKIENVSFPSYQGGRSVHKNPVLIKTKNTKIKK